jgi:Phage phiEco32-like COOH.NH2 ligase-type 2
MTSSIKIGCDPEVFVHTNGIFKSAYNLIPGTKDNPFKVDKGAVQVDGMALEFNIDPACTEDEFCINVQSVYATLCSMVPGYSVVAQPVAHFDAAYMASQPEDALALGCDPDFNAWDGKENMKPEASRPMRTASGHVHIGWRDPAPMDSAHYSRAAMVAREMDVFLGIPSLFYDSDTERREMYGKAGCLRYKPYGVEYRTLSNAWLTSEALMRWVFRSAEAGISRLMRGEKPHHQELFERGVDVQKIINTSDKKAAMKVVEMLNLEVCYG